MLQEKQKDAKPRNNKYLKCDFEYQNTYQQQAIEQDTIRTMRVNMLTNKTAADKNCIEFNGCVFEQVGGVVPLSEILKE